jgi:hypothetical protein
MRPVSRALALAVMEAVSGLRLHTSSRQFSSSLARLWITIGTVQAASSHACRIARVAFGDRNLPVGFGIEDSRHFSANLCIDLG